MPMRARGGRVDTDALTPDEQRNMITTAANEPMGWSGYNMRIRKPLQRLKETSLDQEKDKERARGGRVNAGTKVYEDGKRNGTKISHDAGKSDLPDMNRKRVVTFAAGGKVVKFAAGGRVEASNKVAPATKLPGGGGGGEARLAKAHRASRKG